MSAPEVSAFGDGSHAPGAAGITIDGGGFGAFPGSVWIYQNADLTGLTDQLTVQSWNDIQVSVDIPGSLNNTAGTRYLFVQREDLAWSNAFAFTLEAAGGLTVNAATEVLSLTAQPATVGRGRGVNATTQSLALAAQSATVGRGRGVLASTQALEIVGQPAAVVRGVRGHPVRARTYVAPAPQRRIVA